MIRYSDTSEARFISAHCAPGSSEIRNQESTCVRVPSGHLNYVRQDVSRERGNHTEKRLQRLHLEDMIHSLISDSETRLLQRSYCALCHPLDITRSKDIHHPFVEKLEYRCIQLSLVWVTLAHLLWTDFIIIIMLTFFPVIWDPCNKREDMHPVIWIWLSLH